MEDDRSDPPRGSSLSTQAAGTLLAFLFVLVLAQINTILKDFRDAIFYSLMCSTALRYVKDRIVNRLLGLASDPDRTLLFYPLSVVFVKPVEFMLGVWDEVSQLVRRFQASAEGRRQRGSARWAAWAYALVNTVRSVRASAGGETSSGSKPVRSVRSVRSVGSMDSAAGEPGLNNGRGKTSTIMLRFLIRLVMLQLVVTWIKSTLSSASQVALLAISVTIGLGVATVSLLPYTSLGPLSPQKGRTPKRRRASLGRTSLYEDDGAGVGRGHKRQAANEHAVDGDHDVNDLDDADAQNVDKDADDVNNGILSKLITFVDKAVAPIRSFDAVLKRGIASNAHSLVSAVLILVLVLGSAIGATFLGYQIISECRDVGLSLKDTLSDLGSSGGQRSDDFLSEYRLQANEAIQEYLPVVFEWVESKSDFILQANNLTQAATEGRLLMESIRGPRYCSRDEREKLLVALARAGAHKEACEREEALLAELLSEKTFEFSTALRRFENTLELADGGEDPGDTLTIEATETIQKIEGIETDPAGPEDQGMSLSLDSVLVRAEDELRQYHDAYSEASSNLAKAQRSRVVAERRLALCSTGNLSSTTSTTSMSGRHLRAWHDVGTVIHGGFSKIIRSWDVTGGISDTWNGLHGVVLGLFDNNNGNDSTQTGSPSPAPPSSRMHIDSLRSVVQAATGPLISVGRALFLSTSAALVGTSSLFRFGASLLSFGMQSIIFLSLLFALLSAEDDPLASMIYHLPFPPAARNKAAAALNKSLGGVFVTLFKLCVIHGLFTWVTFIFFDAPLVYLTSTASAAFSIVPFIPSWLVVTPSVTALAVQGRIIPGIVLMGMHFAAYSFGDTEILNEAGGQPYLMSLSVFGGMYAMPANPFLGALAGPCFFSLGTALVSFMGEL